MYLLSVAKSMNPHASFHKQGNLLAVRIGSHATDAPVNKV